MKNRFVCHPFFLLNIHISSFSLTAMQSLPDLICTECSNKFDSASLLLQHFANHVKHLENEVTSINTNVYNKNKIPNLFPINKLYDINMSETDRGSDSGIEDMNPLKFCVVMMEEKKKLQSRVDQNQNNNGTDGSISPKKYQCLYCLKRFGWSTDLKRHTLIHTGERPFQCPDCKSSFTRNFLLQKHQKKVHILNKLPELRPISDVLNKKKRKQHKLLIKHNKSSSDQCQNYIKHQMKTLFFSS